MEIYYHKRCVIKVVDGDDDTARYLILVNKRSISKPKNKSWSPLMLPTLKDHVLSYSNFIFTKNQVLELLEMPYFSKPNRHGRSRIMGKFKDDIGFKRWIMDGFKTAMTIEEHLIAGNRLKVVWYHPGAINQTLYLKTSKDLVMVESKLRDTTTNRLSITFSNDNLKLKVVEPMPSDTYIIKSYFFDERAFLFQSISPGLMLMATKISQIKFFATESIALDFCEKHRERLGRHGYEILPVGDSNHLDHIIDNYGNTLI